MRVEVSRRGQLLLDVVRTGDGKACRAHAVRRCDGRAAVEPHLRADERHAQRLSQAPQRNGRDAAGDGAAHRHRYDSGAPGDVHLRMSDWQERITHETPPAIRAEHELRYRLAAPLILAGGPWADLGCGNGVAAAARARAKRARHAPCWSTSTSRQSPAPLRSWRCPSATLIAGDLTDAGGSASGSRDALLELGEAAPVVTCFEVVEHLSELRRRCSSGRARSRASTA